MKKINTAVRKLKFRLKHDFFSIENIVLIIAVILCLMWTFKSIQAMSKNWELSERLAAEKRSLELLKYEIEAAELENIYFASDEYQEILARKQLDKQFSGENMVILPQNSTTAINKYKSSINDSVAKEYSNFQKWMMYLFPKY